MLRKVVHVVSNLVEGGHFTYSENDLVGVGWLGGKESK